MRLAGKIVKRQALNHKIENLIFASRIVMLYRSRGQWVGWPGPNVKEGEPIPESDPADTSPTAGLLSSQVHNTN